MIYVIAFILPLLVWPTIWADARFLIPIVPFAWILLAKIPDKTALRVIVVILLSTMIVTAIKHREKKETYEDEYLFYCHLDYPKNSVIVSRKPVTFSYYSGLKAMNYPFTPDTMVVRKAISQADYIFFEPQYTTSKYLYAAVKGWEVKGKGQMFHILKVPKN